MIVMIAMIVDNILYNNNRSYCILYNINMHIIKDIFHSCRLSSTCIYIVYIVTRDVCVLAQPLYLSFDVSADLPVVSGALSQEAQHWGQALLVVGALLGAPQRRHVLDKLKGPVLHRRFLPVGSWGTLWVYWFLSGVRAGVAEGKNFTLSTLFSMKSSSFCTASMFLPL